MAQLKSALKKVLPTLSPAVKPKNVPVVKPKPMPSEKVVQQAPGQRKRSLSIVETPRPNNSEQVQPGKRQKRTMSTACNYLVLL